MCPAFQHLQRLAVFTLLAVVAATMTFAQAAPAHADGWCYVDPILSINGKTVHVITEVMGDPAMVRAGVQHAQVTVFLPYGVDARIVGYDGDSFAESAEIVRDGSLMYVPGHRIDMRVEVEFRATAKMPALLAVSVEGSKQQIIGGGTTDAGVRGRYQLHP